MNRNQIVLAACALSTLVLPFGTQGKDIVTNIKKVKGIEHYKGPDSGKALLKKNGFVVVPDYHHRIFSPYYESPLPRFITADSVHRTFHVIFEEQLKKVETAFIQDLKVITDELSNDIRKKHKDKAIAASALQYLQVASSLLTNPENTDKKVADELELIMQATSIAESPIFGYKIDYSQFKPRGFYTETTALRRYFKAMSWYGNAAFHLKSDKETRIALLIAITLQKNKKALAHWQKLDKTYTYLIAGADDLTPLEYANACREIKHPFGSEEFMNAFLGKAKDMRNPKINSTVLNQKQMKNWINLSKGMRLFGKRYIPDSEVFMNLTDPKVPTRFFPCGLDVIAANGSKRAEVLLARRPDTKSPKHKEGLKKSTKMLANLKTSKKTSHYIELLKVAEAITADPPKKAASFAKTTAYSDKNVMTALSTWASLRHAWVLHAKQSLTCTGISEADLMPGYIEPNPEFFKAMKQVNDMSIEIFEEIEGIEVKRFIEFGKLLDSLREMLRKQFTNEKFNKKELYLFENYANKIGELQGFYFNANIDKGTPWMSLICDVHTEAFTRQCLEVGTGGAMPIYIVAEYKGSSHLLKGAVYSYFEFKQPISDRLTDEKWRSWWDGGRIPRHQPWTRSFIAQHDVDSLLKKVSKGKIAEELLYIDDPQIDAFLEKAMNPYSPSADKNNYEWILKTAAIRLKDKATPTLLKMLKLSSLDKRKAEIASRALPFCISKKDIPVLIEMAAGDDKELARRATNIGFRLRNEIKAIFVGKYVTSIPTEKLSRHHIDWLKYRAVSKDITPFILKCYNNTKDPFRKKLMIQVLTDTWARDPYYTIVSPQHIPLASGQEIEAWEKEVKRIVLESFNTEERYIWEHAIKIAGAMKITEVLPEIEKRITLEKSPGSFPTYAPTALANIGTDKAIDLLISLTYAKTYHEKNSAMEALILAKSKRSVPRIKELLEDKSQPTPNDRSMSDMADMVLKAIYPDGPDTTGDSRRQNKHIKEWKQFLKNKKE